MYEHMGVVDRSWPTNTVIVTILLIGWWGGGVHIKNILVEEVGRWLHVHALDAKNMRRAELLVQIA